MNFLNPFIAIFLFLLGAIIGSFLNVVIFRLPKGRKFLGPKQRSRCMHCKKVLQPLDLVPIFSYLFFRGRCRYCHKPLSPQYIIVETLTAAIFVLLYLQHGLDMDFFIGAIGACSLLVLAFIDGRHKIVPDSISLPTLGVLTALQLIRIFTGASSNANSQLLSLLLAIAIGAAWFWLQWFFSRGKWVGSGDIRIGAVLGAYLGFPGVILALFASYLSGSVWAATLLVRGKVKLKSQLPFGVFLGAAGILAFIFGPSVVDWYKQLIGL
ncbi:MAG: prepilin peptidase [Patescibacteria group bacterium]